MSVQFRNIEDGQFYNDTALPNAASTTVNTPALDLTAFSSGTSSPGSGVRPENIEVALQVPALSTTILPNGDTYTLSIQESDDSTFATGVRTLGTLVVTGAGGVGAPASRLQVRVPADGGEFVRGVVVSGAGTTTGAALNAHFAVKF